MITSDLAADPAIRRVGLDEATLREMYRRMLLSRAIDVRAWSLSRQGRAHFVITSRGHEAAEVGSAFALDRGNDWFLPYYRSLALVVGVGMTAAEVMLGIFARRDDPSSGGRQLAMHFSHPHWRIISGSSVVSTQIPHAAGLALAAKLSGQNTVAIAYFGEGGSSKGDFHEGLNFAAVQKLPAIFFCENNGYAISVPQRKQMAIEDVGLASLLPGFTVLVPADEASTRRAGRCEKPMRRFFPKSTWPSLLKSENTTPAACAASASFAARPGPPRKSTIRITFRLESRTSSMR